MSKRKKAVIITLIVLVVIYFLLIGASYFFLNRYVFPAFAYRGRVGEYPCSDAAIPGDFTEYSVQGLKLNAPDCLELKIDIAEVGKYLSNDMEKYDLQITVYEQESSAAELEKAKAQPYLSTRWITGRGWLTKLGMKKIGYQIPESDNELMYLLEKMNRKDYNPLSLIEAYTFTKLSVLGSVFIPAMAGSESYDKEHPLAVPLAVEECTYYMEKDSFNAILRQSCSEGGRYRLTIRYYPDSDAEPVRLLLIQSDDPELARTIAASVRPA